MSSIYRKLSDKQLRKELRSKSVKDWVGAAEPYIAEALARLLERGGKKRK